MTKKTWQPSGMFDTSLETSVYPAGGVQSTARDLLSFGAAVLNNRLVSNATLDDMVDTSASLAQLAGDDAYGLGWSVTEHPDFGTVIAHGGSQPGVSAQFMLLMDHDIVAVALSNAYGIKGSVIDLAYFMADLAFRSKGR